MKYHFIRSIFFTIYIIISFSVGIFIFASKISLPTEKRYFVNIELNNVNYTYFFNIIINSDLWITARNNEVTFLQELPKFLRMDDIFMREYFPQNNDMYLKKADCALECVVDGKGQNVISSLEIVNILQTKFDWKIRNLGNFVEISLYNSDREKARQLLKSVTNAIVLWQQEKLAELQELMQRRHDIYKKRGSKFNKNAISILNSLIINNSYLQDRNFVRYSDLIYVDSSNTRPNLKAWLVVSFGIVVYLISLGWFFMHRLINLTSVHKSRSHSIYAYGACLLFFVSSLNLIGFLRDATSLPLYDGRTEILECLFLFFAIYLLQHGNMYPTSKSQISCKTYDKIGKILFLLGVPIKNSQYTLILIVLFVVSLPVAMLNNSENFFFSLQLLKLILSLIVITLLLQQNFRIENLERLFRYFVYLMCGTLALLFFLRYLSIFTNVDDLIQRNVWSLSAVFYLYFFSLRLGVARYSFDACVVLLMAWIASAKLSILLVIVSPILYIFYRERINSIALKSVTVISIFGIIILMPYILPILFVFEYTDLYILDEFRYYIPSDIGSLVSRIFGVRHLLDNGYLFYTFGLGEMPTEDVLFWGYPIHNLPLQLALAHGVVGWLISIVILVFFVRYTRNFYEVIMIVCAMCYLNDILTITIVCYMLSLSQKNTKFRHLSI